MHVCVLNERRSLPVDPPGVDINVLLIANVFFPLVVAHLALDVAAPHKSAVALFLHVSNSSLVTSATAK